MTEKLERSETRVRTLQEQLQLNASEWGTQKAQMKIEITRLQAQVTALMGQLQPTNRTPAKAFSQYIYTLDYPVVLLNQLVCDFLISR